MDFSIPPELDEIRTAVRELCDRFPAEYWRGLEPDSYPAEFVSALTDHGWLAALIPGGVRRRRTEICRRRA